MLKLPDCFSDGDINDIIMYLSTLRCRVFRFLCVLYSAVLIFGISNRIVTSVFDSNPAQLFKIFEYLPSPISYLFKRMTPIFHLSNDT